MKTLIFMLVCAGLSLIVTLQIKKEELSEITQEIGENLLILDFVVILFMIFT